MPREFQHFFGLPLLNLIPQMFVTARSYEAIQIFELLLVSIIRINASHAQMKICGLVSLRMEIISWKSPTVKVSLQTDNAVESFKKYAAYLEKL